MNQLALTCLLALISFPPAVVVVEAKHHQWQDASVHWDESFDAFVDYPEQALAGLPLERSDALDPVRLDLVVNLADWDQPLFSLLKGIVTRNYRVVAKPYFYIQEGVIYNYTTGAKSHCRRPKPGQPQQEGQDVIYEPVPTENCTRHCTNGGRYCLNHPEFHKDGAQLVKEAARRMCFDHYYQESSRLWDYMERFEEAKCHTAEDMTTCSFMVIEGMDDVSAKDIIDCIEWWGDFDRDVKNQGLQHAIESEKVMHVNQGKEHKDLPMLYVNDVKYQGAFHVKPMLKEVCNAFPEGEKPYACDYCGGCHDVRKCLWHLECDGTPLDTSQFVPIPTPASSSASLTTTNNNTDRWQTGFVWGAIAGLMVAFGFAYKEYRTRRLVQELADNRHQLEDDFQARDIDALVEALDIKYHGSPIPSSSDHSNTACSDGPPSSVECDHGSQSTETFSDEDDDDHICV